MADEPTGGVLGSPRALEEEEEDACVRARFGSGKVLLGGPGGGGPGGNGGAFDEAGELRRELVGVFS